MAQKVPLGIATEITLRILKAAESIQVLLADFNSVEAAGAAVSAITSAGIIPCRSGNDGTTSALIAVEDVVATECYPRDAAAILLIEIDGLSAEVADTGARIQQLCRQNWGLAVSPLPPEPERTFAPVERSQSRLCRHGQTQAFFFFFFYFFFLFFFPDYYVQERSHSPAPNSPRC